MQPHITKLVAELGDFGVFIAMFLESSIMPMPSEVIIIGAGAIGLSFWSVTVFGSVGATLGAIVGYMIGKYAGAPAIAKYGKYVFIKPHHICKAEDFAKKHGVWGVLIGRLLPIIPFKVFSIASGITKIPLGPFVLCTFIGVVPRIILLTFFGTSLVKYTKPTVIIVGLLLLIFISVKITKKIFYTNGKKK
jgi:membrane protein DedA with SNARE-associated domain